MISLLAVAAIAVGQSMIETHVYALPDTGHSRVVWKLTEGPDGAMWFTTGCGYAPCPYVDHPTIGRITRDGAITEYELPLPTPSLSHEGYGITTGPDGALWFGEFQGHQIGRMTTAGVLTEYPLGAIEDPYEITAGPDGALWFTEPNPGGYGVGRISITGAATLYPFGTSYDPLDIVAGADGALWFSNLNSNKGIGRISTNGLATFFPLSGACPSSFGIAAGSDGALWFTCGTNSIGRMTTSGAATTYSIPTPNSQPIYIAAGPDGALWFSEQNGCKLGRITTTGVITEYSGVSACGEIVAGLGDLWTNSPTGFITRITFTSTDTTPPVITPHVTGTLGTNGWYTSDVTVSWDVTDPSSGISSSTGCGTTTLTYDTYPSVTLTCSATNGLGMSASKSITIKIDRSSPVVTPHITGTRGSDEWYTTPVTVSWSLFDGESGIASSSGCEGGTFTENTSGNGILLMCTAINGAGLHMVNMVNFRIRLVPQATDITSQLQIAVSGFALNRLTNTFWGTVTFKNITANTIQGPFYFVAANLGPGSILLNKTGVWADNNPYLLVDGLTTLAPGASASVRVQFNRTVGAITFNPKFYAGGQ